jgi:hypothetical protein
LDDQHAQFFRFRSGRRRSCCTLANSPGQQVLKGTSRHGGEPRESGLSGGSRMPEACKRSSLSCQPNVSATDRPVGLAGSALRWPGVGIVEESRTVPG